MARIAGINIPLNKHIVIALTAIYGVGDSRARLICNVAGVKPETKVKDLAETEVNDLRQAVAKYTCLLYTSPSPRDATLSRMPSSA